MSSDVLVLNRNFCAVHIANWQRALSLVYIDHARVVDEEYRTYNFEDWREVSQLIQNHPSGFVGQINSFPGDLKPTIPPLRNVMRPDVVEHLPGEYTESLLSNAPDREGDYLKVKKIL